jgi:hypothetical protein
MLAAGLFRTSCIRRKFLSRGLILFLVLKGMVMMILILLLVLLVGAEVIWLEIRRTFSDAKTNIPPDTEIRP